MENPLDTGNVQTFSYKRNINGLPKIQNTLLLFLSEQNGDACTTKRYTKIKVCNTTTSVLR